ncbi:hypothetical protein MVEN_01144300 [Mycena venus]|uniref:NB-ARC domain-containing protein n=1 Tax=Mycena venus TaxID=2733690 RepID=A0A8H6Y4V3_9AGAR|nr:hypothetical protein MVEN_01144300 [Mycena venus]
MAPNSSHGVIELQPNPMPPLAISQAQLPNLASCLSASADSLDVLANSFYTPFLVAISDTTRSLLNYTQNKANCVCLLEQTYRVNAGIIASHVQAETGGELPPQSTPSLGPVQPVFAHEFESSRSISLLPSKPKIFFGREEDVSRILDLFGHADPPRVAILGLGGVGKTSLARAILHHDEIISKFSERRTFVACESALNMDDLVALIRTYFSLKPQKNFIQAILKHLACSPPSLLDLECLETIWEPLEYRKGIEDLLSRLSEIPNLSLMITMRGAERPASVQWTRPLLRTLLPLTPVAARNIFVATADDWHEDSDIAELLKLAENIPLAIDLLAHLADADLLGLLSLLPDGLADTDVLQGELPIDNIGACKTTLL